MLDKINSDIKEAMKSKQKERLEALRYLKAMLMENSTSKKPEPELDVVAKHQKKLRDSMDAYPDGHAAKEKITAELEVVSEYLPQPFSEEEVQSMISEIIKGLGDSPQMGMVMKELSPQIKGRFDGKKASQLVQAALK